MNVRGIARNEIILFLDNCGSHTSYYSQYNLYNQSVKCFFNCACTPCFNIIETVFCDLKCFIRKKNKTKSHELIDAARDFLNNCVNHKFMLKKICMCCKYFIKALECQEF